MKQPRSLKMVLAKWAVKKAIKQGILSRQPCETCGGWPSEAHHADYDKPLDIRWLCKRHHQLHHRDNGPGLNAGEKTVAPDFAEVLRPRPINQSPLMDGRLGGHARSVSLSPEQRRDISRRAALARWNRDKADKSAGRHDR